MATVNTSKLYSAALRTSFTMPADDGGVVNVRVEGVPADRSTQALADYVRRESTPVVVREVRGVGDDGEPILGDVIRRLRDRQPNREVIAEWLEATIREGKEAAAGKEVLNGIVGAASEPQPAPREAGEEGYTDPAVAPFLLNRGQSVVANGSR